MALVSDQARRMAPLLVSVKEAAQAIDICRAQLYKLIAAGEIRTAKIGSRRLVLTDSLAEFVERMVDPA